MYRIKNPGPLWWVEKGRLVLLDDWMKAEYKASLSVNHWENGITYMKYHIRFCFRQVMVNALALTPFNCLCFHNILFSFSIF